LRNKKLRRASAVALAGVVVAIGTVTSASAAALPILHSSSSTTGQEAHQCQVIGNDGTTQAVVCADILTGVYDADSGEGSYARDQVEAYCQTISTGAVVQCADVLVTYGLNSAANDSAYPDISSDVECGHAYGACSTGRNVWSNVTYDYPWSKWTSSNCDSNVNGESSVWSVIYGGNDTIIELPKSDKSVALTTGNDGGNEISGHYFICQ
jgi:hypothetical protein